MLSWRLLGVGIVILLAGALVSLALSAPAAEEGPATLRQAQGGEPLSAAASIVREFPVVTNTADQEWPAVSGDIVVWTDYRNGNLNRDIYGKCANLSNVNSGLGGSYG